MLYSVTIFSRTWDMKIQWLMLLCLACGATWSQVDSLSAVADQYYAEENYAEALRHYHSALEKDSTQLSLYERAGLAAMKLGQQPEARALFIRLESKDSSNVTALRQLATIYEREENIPKGIKYYNRLVQLYPDRGLYYRKLGELYREAGLIKDALRYYTQANVLNPADMSSLRGLSELLLSEKVFAEADSLLRAGLEMDSLNIRLNLIMAKSKFRQKQYDSTAYYVEVIRGKYVLKPQYQKMLGYAYIQIDSFDRAIYHLTKAISNEGTKEYAHYNLAVAYEALDDMESAKYHLREAINSGISKDVDLYHRNLARLHNKEDNLKEAIPHYQDAYKYGEDPVLLFYLARASDKYYEDKNVALRYYRKFIKSPYEHKEYKDYAAQRVAALKEYLHQSK